MDLQEFLADEGISASELGRRAGITQGQISSFNRAATFPRGQAIKKLIAASGGKITAQGLFDFWSLKA